MTKTVCDVLVEARDRIKPEGKWTRGHLAVNSHGESTFTLAPNAVAWCAIGSIVASVDDDDQGEIYAKAVIQLVRAIDPLDESEPDSIDPLFKDDPTTLCVTDFNDDVNRTQSEVIEIFDKAIAGCNNP